MSVAKTICVSVALFFLSVAGYQTQAQEIMLTGIYQGKNLYIQNPLSEDKINFCTRNVFVNGHQVIDHPKTSAFEVNLSAFNVNDTVNIRIEHHPNCAPKVINPQVIRAKSQFQFLSVQAENNLLRWFTKGENSPGYFMIEEYLEDKWIIVKSVNAIGSSENHQYKLQLDPGQGLSKFRIKYMPQDGNSFYSQIVEINLNEESPVTFYPTRVTDKITLSRETDYEVLDSSGNSIVKGSGSEINLEELTTGLYYLNIENKTEKFFKK
ncbi:MAG: T9SS type A sorting domain-containing protein [Candidatus Cyclobacteriaceae bacterium M3_2C_046]